MSLNGALLTGVSALDANSRALTITSSNIANVNTTGYKTNSGAFSTFLAATTQPGEIAPGGVSVGSKADLLHQGLLQSSSSATDLAVSGNGFFIVTKDPTSTTQGDLYTRVGSFSQDQNGYLKNASGYYLKGWQLDSSGNLPANRSTLVPINLSSLSSATSPTTAMNLQANLQATTPAIGGYTAGDITSGTRPADFEQTFNVFDSQGGTRPLKVAFAKTAANTWNYEITYEGAAAHIGGAGNNPIKSGAVTFNADGTMATPSAGTSFTIPWAASTGLASQAVNLSFGTAGQSDGVTQFASNSSLISAGVNGAPSGALTSVSVNDEGYVTALYDNGIEQRVFKLPVATFANANGLATTAGNAYQISEASGTATVVEAKSSGAGSIASSSLEASTVDLAKEFTDLITTQRAYSAATKIITTADDMMQELIQVKR